MIGPRTVPISAYSLGMDLKEMGCRAGSWDAPGARTIGRRDAEDQPSTTLIGKIRYDGMAKKRRT
jgi:hypothetical protein